MRLDSTLFEPLITRAALSPQEAQWVRLTVLGESIPRELGRQMGCKPSTVLVHKSNARKKMAPHLEWFIKKLHQDAEEHFADADTEFFSELLAAMRVFVPCPGPRLIGETWVEMVETGERVTLCLTGAAHAGALITVDDLKGRRVPRLTAKENRERLARKGRAA